MTSAGYVVVNIDNVMRTVSMPINDYNYNIQEQNYTNATRGLLSLT